MTPEEPRRRMYWRGGRAWADFRDYSDVGGKREPLKAPGSKMATKDPDQAAVLMAERLKELERLRRDPLAAEPPKEEKPAALGLAEYAARHLLIHARDEKASESWLVAIEGRLRDAIEYFGTDRPLDSITPTDVEDWKGVLAERPTHRFDPDDPEEDPKKRRRLTFSPATIRHYLNALSGLYRRAEAERIVPPGFNPVAGMIGKPRGTDEEARFLSVPEAALLLEAARTYKAKRSDMVSVPHIYEVLATFLLTGGRKNEVLGLAPEDVSFDRGVIMFRKNEWRDLKTKGSRRIVPLWPQLREILEPYMDPASRPPGRLLFPSRRGPGMIHDLRRPLEAIAKRAGLDPAEIHIHAFRHTYTAARLQTLDHGAPIQTFTVARELGHTSTALVERIYGHVSGRRHRSEEVEYRADQHAELGERVRAIRAKAAAGR